ncbi:hypothetical protein QAA18_10950 [Luteimonas sp. 8-5]|uniref:hypothetical protein n=1 Tax=Luteimonas sp. 8-5 TaxID=3039387 RepID=UPI00243715BD|nr:hypothetical protein [Luteimonas sp. 8-5]MDG6349242.1 hypothetical protein [Luteimonas sp. 8-5]
MSLDPIPVWRQVTPELEAELLEFWKRNNAIGDDGRARQRASQAVCIARDDDGTVCAVGTATVRVLPRLRQPTYSSRQFYDSAQRGKGQALAVANASRQVLQAYNASLPVPEALGMLIEVQNPMLAKRYDVAFEPVTGYSFIGYSPRGFVLRVSWFDGATLLPPAPIHQKQRKTTTGIPA